MGSWCEEFCIFQGLLCVAKPSTFKNPFLLTALLLLLHLCAMVFVILR